MERADSTQPPPGTTEADSRARLTAQRASWSERSTSSSMWWLAPRSRTEQQRCVFPPEMTRWSSSQMRSSLTSSAEPSIDASNDSSPSMSASVIMSVPPVSFAMRRRSSFLTRRSAMQFASTKYLRAMSSMPLVVRMTFAPALISSWIRSLVMSASRLRISSSFLGSVTTTLTPIAILVLRRSMSSNAIFAPLTERGMPCAARPPCSTYPLISCESLAEPPCCLRMPTDLIG
mmetsp:Transcript_6185/g.17910  ORF Transcript_6185/g.17910 Transcript_6185/m.17910 type:complete len:232 (-) Transcript_6185:632-1327(-)